MEQMKTWTYEYPITWNGESLKGRCRSLKTVASIASERGWKPWDAALSTVEEWKEAFNFLCSYWQLLLVHSYQIMLFVAVLQLLVGSNVRGSPSASSKVKLYICKQHTVQFLPEFQKEVTNATLITEQSIMCTAGAQQASIKSKIVNLRVDQFLK